METSQAARFKGIRLNSSFANVRNNSSDQEQPNNKSSELISPLSSSKHRDSSANLNNSLRQSSFENSLEKEKSIGPSGLEKMLSLQAADIEFIEDEFDAPAPISPEFKKVTHIINEEYIINIYFNYSMVDAKYYVVNQLSSGDYILSEAYTKVTPNQEYDHILVNFVTSDIGQLPYLLIEDDGMNFIIPLTTRPVEPDSHVQQLLKNLLNFAFKCNISVINLDDGRVQYGSFIQDQTQGFIIEDRGGKSMFQFSKHEIDAILPCSLYYNPSEHPVTYKCETYYDQCLIYQDRLSFLADHFFKEEFTELVYPNDPKERVYEDSYLNLIIKIRSKMMVFNFMSIDDRDLAYLSVLKIQNSLYPIQNTIEIEEHKNIIHAPFERYKEYDTAMLSRALFTVEQKEYVVNDLIKVQNIAGNSHVFGLVCNKDNIYNYFKYNPKEENTLLPDYVYKEVQIAAFDNYSVYTVTLTNKLLPVNDQDIRERMDQIESRGVIIRCQIKDVHNKDYEAKIVLIDDTVEISCDEPEIKITCKKNLLKTCFNYKNAFLMRCRNESIEFHVQEKDYFYLNIFFSDCAT